MHKYGDVLVPSLRVEVLSTAPTLSRSMGMTSIPRRELLPCVGGVALAADGALAEGEALDLVFVDDAHGWVDVGVSLRELHSRHAVAPLAGRCRAQTTVQHR